MSDDIISISSTFLEHIFDSGEAWARMGDDISSISPTLNIYIYMLSGEARARIGDDIISISSIFLTVYLLSGEARARIDDDIFRSHPPS